MPKRIVISDIHGNAKTFRALVLKLNIKKGDTIYILGDFIDRGPNSKDVFDAIFQLMNNGIEVLCTKGNHEDLMLESFYDGNTSMHWALYCGGAETLTSFGVESVKDVPEKYIHFIEKMPYYLRVDDYLMVHAGFDFNNDLSPLHNRKQMLWIRNWYNEVDYKWLGEDIIIHGHTPIDKLGIQTMKEHLKQKRIINIDNGCFKYNNEDFGSLCAFDIDSLQLTFQKNMDF